jgi:hypothetical protein
LKSLECIAAADERRLDRPREGRNIRQEPRQAVRRDRLGLTLQREWLDRLGLDGVADERMCTGPEEDFARVCRLLEPGGDVHGVARHERLAPPGYDLSRVEADPHLESEPGDGAQDLVGRAYRPQRVVLVRLRDAEHRHRGVPDELLDRAAVTLEQHPELSVVAGHQLA